MDLMLRAGEFYGSPVESRTISGFNLIESVYEARGAIPRHCHELANLCLVLKGSYTERYGRICAERSASEIIFHPAGVVHTEDHHEPGRHLMIEVQPQWFDCFTLPAEPCRMRDRVTARLSDSLYREFRTPDQYSILALQGLVLELTAHALRGNSSGGSPKPPVWLRRVKENLRDAFPATPTLATLAEAVEVHPVYLASAFRRFEGCTVGEYVRRLRVEKAAARITRSNDSLAQIALECGFADQTHFTRMFRRVTGMTPAKYRRTFRVSPRLKS